MTNNMTLKMATTRHSVFMYCATPALEPNVWRKHFIKKWFNASKPGTEVPSCLLARITVVAPDRACVLVELAVDVGAHRMIAQVKIGGVQSWIPTPENQRNVVTVF